MEKRYKMPKFLKRDSGRLSKFGKRRKKMQSWRRPKGRDNKMREKRKGYPAVVRIGYAQSNSEKGKINKKIPKIIKNIKDLESIKKEEIGILGKIGNKKRIEIVKKAKEMKVELYKVDIGAFLKRLDKINAKKELENQKNKKTKENKK